MVMRQIIFFKRVLCLSLLFLYISAALAFSQPLPKEIRNRHYLVRYGGEDSLTADKISVIVQQYDSDIQTELVIGGKAFQKQYQQDSIVNVQTMQLFETFLIVHGEMWNNGELILIFDLDTGNPLQIAGENIAGVPNGISLWCYSPVSISKRHGKIAFVNGYPRNVRGVHEVVSVLDLNNLKAPPVQVYPKIDKKLGTSWRLEDEEMFVGIMGNMIWTPNEKGLVLFEGTTLDNVRKHVNLVHIDLSNGVKQSKIFKERFNVNSHLQMQLKQGDAIPYFFPSLEMENGKQVNVRLTHSATREDASQSKTSRRDKMIWKSEQIILPLPQKMAE